MSEPSDHDLLVMLLNRVNDIAEDLKDTRYRIYGNGKQGLLEDMSDVKSDIEQIRGSISTRDKVLMTFAGMVVTLVVGFLWQVFTGQVTVTFP